MVHESKLQEIKDRRHEAYVHKYHLIDLLRMSKFTFLQKKAQSFENYKYTYGMTGLGTYITKEENAEVLEENSFTSWYRIDCVKQLHEYLFGNADYQPSNEVTEISSKINSETGY